MIEQPLVVSRIEEDQSTLHSRFQEWGYLHFKKYISNEKCSALLKTLVDQLAPHVALDVVTCLPVLTGAPFVETDAIWDAVYPKIQSQEKFHQFFHEPDMLALMKKMAGKEAFVYPMKMARISTPGKIGYETPPHQDARSHAAGPTMAGIWIALHDISAEMGRLKLLPGSHKNGVRPVVPSVGVGNVQCEIYPEETTWHVSDVTQGDVIIFHSATIHAAQPNTSEKVVRMSVDTRFCDFGAAVASFNTEPHHAWRIPGLDWAYIYRQWQDKSLQYYWQDYPNFIHL